MLDTIKLFSFSILSDKTREIVSEMLRPGPALSGYSSEARFKEQPIHKTLFFDPQFSEVKCRLILRF